MEIISGNKEYFFDFLDNLKKTDKIAILSHTDLDGIASAIILKEILKSKKINQKVLKFVDYEKGMFEKWIIELENKKINKIIISDIAVDVLDEGYNNFKEKFEFFIIDHHPFEKDDPKNMIKTKSEDCATFSLFQLAQEYLKKYEKKLDSINELVCTTMISEFSYSKKENLEFIKKSYPEIIIENINDSLPGKLSKQISSTIIYFRKNKKKVFNLIYKNKQKELVKYYNIVDREINKYVEKYEKEKTDLNEKIHFYYLNPSSKFAISSIVTTIISLKNQDKTIVTCSEINEDNLFIKASARNQSGEEDMNLLMKKSIHGLEEASGGGHVKAAAARFLKKDLEKFKENLLR